MDDLIAEVPGQDITSQPDGSVTKVFKTFLRLGLTSFGGPIAHIGYFRREFVDQQRWVDESTFADLVALCQFLPGPASSQVGFALGLSRAGLMGGLAAWIGFTLPSAILLLVAAGLSTRLTSATGAAAIHGLKIVAVAVVAQAVWGMARALTPDLRRATIAVMAGAIVFLVAGSFGQIAAIALGGIAGLIVCRNLPVVQKGILNVSVPPLAGYLCLAAFLLFLVITPLIAEASGSRAVAVFDAFYRTGALVFGGGHVVLPLLHDAVVRPGWISANTFLTGYGAAQAVPGPLFTIAAYLGAALNRPPNGIPGSVIALIAIFLPGMLLVTGTLPFWDGFRTKMSAQATIRGVNAAVVGILAAALYDPLWKSAIYDWRDAVLALAGFSLLTFGKAVPLLIVIGITTITIGFSVFH